MIFILVELSLPQPELNAWLRAEQETIPTHESRPTQNMNVRGKDPPMIQNMEEDWNKKDGIFKQTNAQSIYIDESESSNSLERDEASVSSSQSNAGPSHSAHSATLLSDVVGHAAVKLRIEEVLLPISLPSELADSVLTGKLNMLQLLKLLPSNRKNRIGLILPRLSNLMNRFYKSLDGRYSVILSFNLIAWTTGMRQSMYE